MCTKCNKEHITKRLKNRWARTMNNTPYLDVKSYPVRCDDINCKTKKIRTLHECNCCSGQFCKDCTASHWIKRYSGRERSPYGYRPKKRVVIKMIRIV